MMSTASLLASFITGLGFSFVVYASAFPTVHLFYGLWHSADICLLLPHLISVSPTRLESNEAKVLFY